MSCATLNQQSIGLNVAIGALPEGFCPASMQELAQAIADRLIVTPGATFNGFAIGSVEPASNVGPWFKDCEQFFVFDDETARYVPISKFATNSFRNVTVISDSGTFVVPEFVYTLKVSAWGGGGGGFQGTGGGGGGGGAYGYKVFDVVPGQNIAVTIGAGGAGGSPGIDGGDTTFLTLVAGGGKGSTANGPGGSGGAATGADLSVNGGYGMEGYSSDGGHGGDSPNGGQGGVANSSVAAAGIGVVPGGGGTGAGNGINAAAAGANGRVVVEY